MLEHRSFADIVGEIDNGECLALLSRRVAEVSAAVVDTAQRGEVTLKLTIKPNGKAVFVDAEVKAKTPEEGIKTSIFFVAKGGNLSRRDPEQQDLKIRAVSEVA